MSAPTLPFGPTLTALQVREAMIESYWKMASECREYASKQLDLGNIEEAIKATQRSMRHLEFAQELEYAITAHN